MMDDTIAEPKRRRSRAELLVIAALSAAVVLPLLRVAGIITWSWAVTLAPFTATGAIFLLTYVMVFARIPYLSNLGMSWLMKSDDTTVTPPPDHLEPPVHAEDAGEKILAQHPEILAALCLGFRMKQLMPAILGAPVTDPWGVYAAALDASSMELQQLRVLARQHTELYANSGRRKAAKKPSDAHLMRAAVEQFRRCAERTATKGGPPDCPFEHVVVIFGTRSPNRDANLRVIAPRVRSLLERQYPQIATAKLADGSQVKFSDWQKQAARDRAEVARVHKDKERLAADLERANSEIASMRAQLDALRADIDRARADARAAARAEQESAVTELRTALDRANFEHARDVQRAEAELAKLLASVESLTAERDELERTLFSQQEDEELPVERDYSELSGLRILLVGGDSRMLNPLRELAGSFGVQLIHDDSVNAATLVGSVDIVVFWIKYLRHPKYHVVRRECRVRGATHCYWTRTSPASLLDLVASARSGALAGHDAGTGERSRF